MSVQSALRLIGSTELSEWLHWLEGANCDSKAEGKARKWIIISVALFWDDALNGGSLRRNRHIVYVVTKTYTLDHVTVVYLVTSDAAGIVEVEYFLKNLLDLIRLPFNSLAIIQSMTFTSEFRLIDHPKNHIWSLITKKSKIILTLVKMNTETGNRWSVYTSLYRLFCNKIRIKLDVFGGSSCWLQHV